MLTANPSTMSWQHEAWLWSIFALHSLFCSFFPGSDSYLIDGTSNRPQKMFDFRKNLFEVRSSLRNTNLNFVNVVSMNVDKENVTFPLHNRTRWYVASWLKGLSQLYFHCCQVHELLTRTVNPEQSGTPPPCYRKPLWKPVLLKLGDPHC